MWESARRLAMNGEINFIIWLRKLIKESYETGLWVPPAYVRRLRQLERGDLVMQTSEGNALLPLHAELPQPFATVCELMGWNFPTIVPTWDNKFEDARDRTDKSIPSKEVITGFVKAVCETHRTIPEQLEGGAIRDWIVKDLIGRGHSVR